MFGDVQNRVRKAGQAPGTLVYTGEQKEKPSVISLASFNSETCEITSNNSLSVILEKVKPDHINWIHVEGLTDVSLIKQLSEHFHVHPLTIEDILNVEQRPKVDEFEEYLFVTLKILKWKNERLQFSVKQVSIVIGKEFVLSFVESGDTLFHPFLQKLESTTNQRLRQQKADYLAYRMIDAIVDDYFLVLEGLGEQIETVEENIIAQPSSQHVRMIYKLKRQILVLRKAIWPMREAVNHLQYAEEHLISTFTRLYLRDVYDHTMQAIDTIETFRDMLSSMLDMYLSGLTIRMNEIMKTLTIITTVFIPITALASIYGMNLPDIPLMKSHWGFTVVSAVMAAGVGIMFTYFKRKKWM